MLAVLGAQHGRHLCQVGVVAALLGAGGETERDDSLGDVDQVHLIALLHGLDHTLAPARGQKEAGRCSSLPILCLKNTAGCLVSTFWESL